MRLTQQQFNKLNNKILNYQQKNKQNLNNLDNLNNDKKENIENNAKKEITASFYHCDDSIQMPKLTKQQNIEIELKLSKERESNKKFKFKIKKKHYEDEEQISLMQQVALKFPTIVDILIHIPNGGSRKGGVIEGARFKRLGVKAGVSDLFLPLARHNKHGLWIEFKAAKPHHSPVSKMQQEWIDKMLENGYAAYVCYGVDEALKILENYLNK